MISPDSAAHIDCLPCHCHCHIFGILLFSHRYLVTEELLLEAHESLDEAGHDGGHVWRVDLCFVVGFLISLCLQKAQNASG
jgi:hypothetical protein